MQFLTENSLSRFKTFEVVASTSVFDLSLTKKELKFTKSVRGIDPSEVEGISVTAANAGTNGQHTVALGAVTFVVGEVYTLSLKYNILDKGTPDVFKYTFVATSTTAATVGAALVAQIQADSRYASAPFTVAGTSTLTFTDAPKGDLIAGEATALDIQISASGAVVTIGAVANVKPNGQPAQITRIANLAAAGKYPSVQPSLNFVGSVDSATTYTTIVVTHRLNKKTGNPVSEAERNLVAEVMFVAATLTEATYFAGVAGNYAGSLGVGEGTDVTLTKSATITVNSTVPVGVTSVVVPAGTNNDDIFLANGFSVGHVLTVNNTDGDTVDVNGNGETIEGAATLAVATTVIVTLRKISASNWDVV